MTRVIKTIPNMFLVRQFIANDEEKGHVVSWSPNRGKMTTPQYVDGPLELWSGQLLMRLK